MIAEAGSTRGEESCLGDTNSCVPDKAAETERAGATTAGNVGLRVQQSPWTVAPDSAMEAQQSCPPFCICCRQISAGAARAAINKMATAARWKTPCNMVSAYYGGRISR